MKGLSLGAPYAFDREAYSRFYPLAKKVGYALDQEKSPDQDFDAPKFMHVFPKWRSLAEILPKEKALKSIVL